MGQKLEEGAPAHNTWVYPNLPVFGGGSEWVGVSVGIYRNAFTSSPPQGKPRDPVVRPLAWLFLRGAFLPPLLSGLPDGRCPQLPSAGPCAL
eukprot:2480116-Pyramimonas_sp.AAC.1